MADKAFPVDHRDPGFSVDTPLADRRLLGVLVVIDMNEGHILTVRSLEALDDPVFVNAGGAVDRRSEKDKDGTMVVDGMGEALTVQMIRDIHRADVSKALPHGQNRIVGGRSPRSFFGKGEEPVASCEGAEGDKQQEKKQGAQEGLGEWNAGR